MKFWTAPRELPRFVVLWLLLAGLAGFLSGCASALFLWSLDWVSSWRENHRWIIAALPIAGLGVGWVYHRIGEMTGAGIEKGNDLILEEIHDPKKAIPFAMAPLVLTATLISHLFGGSVGREGTAIQMGGALADQISGGLKIGKDQRRLLLMAGMSGGFASVFGTPLAGAVFGLEVLAAGALSHEALFPCLIAAVAGYLTTHVLGVTHGEYHVSMVPMMTVSLAGMALVAGIVFGGVGLFFSRSMHWVQGQFRARISYPPLRPFVGGMIVAVAVWASGTTRYIGLGLPAIHESFDTLVPLYDWAAKFAFTVLTLGAGFKGGEVTPLFFIGSTLGNALSQWIALPLSLLSAMGFVAVFSGAANTPIAGFLMGVELFGAESAVFIAIACVGSYLFSGRSGIYRAQRRRAR